jgi:NAD(P)-dependent dehydrogenase (short-subunit alcohol dehydrogenase family)
MATIAITGATDGIGLATAQRLLAAGHRVLVNARSPERGRTIIDGLDGDAVLVTGDLAVLAEVRELADQLAEHGPLDALIHNAGVMLRGGMPRVTPDGLEMTFAVNVLAPHLLTGLLADQPPERLLWLGSGMARSGRVRPDALGVPQGSGSAYADSKACDVALALAWGRRLPDLASVAVDPGWVTTKLATPGAPGQPSQSAVTLAYCATEADLTEGAYWRDRRPIPVPSHLRDPALQDELAAACDRLSGL